MFILWNPFRLLSGLLRVGIHATAHCSSRISNIWPISSQTVAFLFAWWVRVTARARTHKHTHIYNISGEISHSSSLSLNSAWRRVVTTTAKSNYQLRQISPTIRTKYSYFRRKDFRAVFIFGFLMEIGRYIPISVTIGQITDRSLLDPWRHRHELSSKRRDEPLAQWKSVTSSTTALCKPRIRNNCTWRPTYISSFGRY